MSRTSLAWVDGPTGLAGNMLLAALFDLGLPRSVVEEPLAQLGLANRYRLLLEERRSGGLRGLHLAVEPLEAQPQHRPWGELRQQLSAAPLEEALRRRVLAVFELLAEAEAAVHGQAPEAVHFHELGAIDALVDVVGVCAGLLHFGIERLICTPPPAGHGTVTTAHGLLPLPAPAVLEIARRRAIPLASSAGFPAAELTTPTGLALMAAWAEAFTAPPALLPRAMGCGLGSRQLDRPNLLRLVLAEPAAQPVVVSPLAPLQSGLNADGEKGAGAESWQPLLVQQAQIDDASAEDLAFLAEALRQAGAVEVYAQAVQMKKGRLGTQLTALASPAVADELRAVWWRHGTSLGLRERLEGRWRLPRSGHTLATPLGPVRLKTALRPGDEPSSKPEYEDLAALARRHGLSLRQLRGRIDRLLAEAVTTGEGVGTSTATSPGDCPAEAPIDQDRGDSPTPLGGC